MPSLRFGVPGHTINCENGGDILESVGGFLRPWSLPASVERQRLAEQYGFDDDAVVNTLNALTCFVKAASFAYAHAKAYANRVLPTDAFRDFLTGALKKTGACSLDMASNDCVLCVARAKALGELAEGYFDDDPGSLGESAPPPPPPPVFEPPAPVPDEQRTPKYVKDSRFSVQRAKRVVVCDECQDICSGSGVGAFVQEARSELATQREALWKAGQVDAHWYCMELSLIHI